ncbi:ester cyclase [Frankia sp. Cppng1_Ct_nod]|uniref:ester cyclase n=1 Tax=Frankia sp. Cppng1_Ct_nod TaxID=2897162 RepID=UPI0010415806|nr:ester cyclase [Frankia sp. Cppng1_Ct_nod]
MSDEKSVDQQLHVQGRDAVIAQSDGVEWRGGKPPNYHFSKVAMPHERISRHAEGSLADIVERVVQVFELELSYKKNPAQWVSMVADQLRVRVNGGPSATAEDLVEKGSYNMLIGENPYYSASEETFESSHQVFHDAFPGGFFWEVLDVYSPPPVITFKWRHWGTFNGPYKGFEPTGKRLEIFGVTVARCTDDLRLVEVEHFYDNSEFLSRLTGGCPV